MHSAIIVSNHISFISERKNVATKQSFQLFKTLHTERQKRLLTVFENEPLQLNEDRKD